MDITSSGRNWQRFRAKRRRKAKSKGNQNRNSAKMESTMTNENEPMMRHRQFSLSESWLTRSARVKLNQEKISSEIRSRPVGVIIPQTPV